MTREETIFKMTECANELYFHGDYDEAIVMLQSIDRLCDSYGFDMPDEAIDLNANLDEQFNTDVLTKKIK